jgi:hypothetical protein
MVMDAACSFLGALLASNACLCQRGWKGARLLRARRAAGFVAPPLGNSAWVGGAASTTRVCAVRRWWRCRLVSSIGTGPCGPLAGFSVAAWAVNSNESHMCVYISRTSVEHRLAALGVGVYVHVDRQGDGNLHGHSISSGHSIRTALRHARCGVTGGGPYGQPSPVRVAGPGAPSPCSRSAGASPRSPSPAPARNGGE